jgi:hypothetical protein
MTMNYSALNEARAKVAAARAAIAQDNEALQEIQNQIAVLQARIKKLEQVQEAKGLRAALAAAERELTQAEEAALDEINLELAGEIVRRQALDPLRYHKWIAEHVTKLAASVRSELDTSITKKYAVHPLITQALALMPPKDGIDRPVWDLGYQVHGTTDWASRRRTIIAAAEADATTPLEAA